MSFFCRPVASAMLLGAVTALSATSGQAFPVPSGQATPLVAVDRTDIVQIQSHRTRRDRHRDRYDEHYGSDPYVLGDEYDGVSFFIGEQPNGRFGCRYRYSGYHTEKPCWARRSLAPPRDR